MSESITFRGTTVRYLDLRQGKEGGDVFCRIHLSSDFSDTVRDKMGWEDAGSSVNSAKLTGELLAQNFILTPGDKNLKQHELQIAISDATDFQLVALKDDDGEISGHQLRFIVRSPGDGVEALVGQYIRRVGRHQGELKISYEPVAKQTELEMGQAKKAEAEKDTGCVACNAEIPLMEGDDSKHASGVKCTRKKEAAPLASAAQMGTATHAGKRKGGQIADPVVPSGVN